MEKFVEYEIYELCKINNFDFKDTYRLYLNSKLDIEDLKKIKDLKVRSLIYECLVAYEKKLLSSNLINDVYEIVRNIHDTKEKGYLVEKKTLEKIKKLFEIQNNANYEFLCYKISYIISRRLFFVYNGNMECEQNNELDLSLLLQQIVTDIMSYLNMLKIHNRVAEDFNETYLKSFVLRTLKNIEIKNKKIEFSLKKINGMTVYFVKSSYNREVFLHFYARVFLSEPIVMHWENIGLNGGYHYLNKRRIIEPNIYNNYNKFTDELIDFVEKQNKIKFFIDKKMIKLQKEEVIDQLKKDTEVNREWGEYFSEIKDLSEKEINDVINLQIYKKKIKNNQYIKKIDNIEELKKIEEILNKGIISDVRKKKLENKKNYIKKLLDKNILISDPKIHNKWVQKDFSYAFLIKVYLEYIDFFKDYEDPLHFSIYFDFRGRSYFNSMVAPSQGWPFRFIYNFDKEDFSKEDNLIEVEIYEKEIKMIEEKIGELDIIKKKSLVWVLLSLGAITIKKKDKIAEEEFIREGTKNYLERIKIEDRLENSELMYYYSIIDNYNNGDGKNRYILKDISGSIFQNASVILGIKNENALELLNIDNDVWNDPYAPLIKRIRENIREELKVFFNRKTLKKPIMTKYYNAKILKSFDYFILEAKKMKEYDDILFNDLWKEFKKVYELLKNLEKELIYENSNEDYNKFLTKKNINIINFEGIKFSILSYTLEPVRVDIKVNGKRLTTTTYRATKKIYKQKTQNSMIPNIFHGEDSSRARALIKDFKGNCFSIHDAFGVSQWKINELIISANNTFDINRKRDFYMNKNEVERRLFSKYIVL